MCIILLKMRDFLLHKNSLDFMLKLADYLKKMRHAFLILAEKVNTYLRAINIVFSILLKKKELLKIAFLK